MAQRDRSASQCKVTSNLPEKSYINVHFFYCVLSENTLDQRMVNGRNLVILHVHYKLDEKQSMFDQIYI